MLCFLPFFHVFPLHPTPLITIYKTDLIIFLSLFQKNTSKNFPPLSSWSSGRAGRIRPNSQRARDRNKMRPGLQATGLLAAGQPDLLSGMSIGLMYVHRPHAYLQSSGTATGLSYVHRPQVWTQASLISPGLTPPDVIKAQSQN